MAAWADKVLAKVQGSVVGSVGYDATNLESVEEVRAMLAPPRHNGAATLFSGVLTRTGVFTYPDGVRELRLPEMLLAWEGLDGYAGLPLLLGPDHPKEVETDKPIQDRERIFDREETEKNSIGALLRVTPIFDWRGKIGEDLLAGVFSVTRKDGVEAIKTGSMGYLSVGFVSFRIKEAGEWRGERYTHRSVAFVPDHVIITPTPRAGPVAVIRADSYTIAPTKPQEDTVTVKLRNIKIGPFDYEVAEDAAKAIIEEQAKAKAEADSARGEATKHQEAAAQAAREKDRLAGELAAAQIEVGKYKRDLEAARAEAQVASDSLGKEAARVKALEAQVGAGHADEALVDLLAEQGFKPSAAAKLLREDRPRAVKALGDSFGVELPANPSADFLSALALAHSKFKKDQPAAKDAGPLGVGRALADSAPQPGDASPTPPPAAKQAPKAFGFGNLGK